MTYQKIQLSKITKIAKNGSRCYKLEPFFEPSFKFEFHKDSDNIIIFPSKFEEVLKDEVEAENKKRLEQYLVEQRPNNKPREVNEVFVEQGTQEWLLLRKGLVTASKPCFDIKGNPIPTFNEYVNKKVADKFEAELMGEELIIEDAEKEFKNEAMKNGNALEDIAIERYEKQTGNKVVKKGFVTADGFGVSHDGITTDEDFNKINIEVKNLITSSYLSQVMYGTAEKRYYAQMQMQMYVLNCDLTHLLVQCQREEKLGVKMELLIVEVERNEEFIMNMIDTLALFEKEFKERYSILQEKVLGGR